MRKLLFMVCCLAAFVTMAAAPEPNRGKELSQKIEPALKTIEKMLDEIEADFWKNIWELDRIHGFFDSGSLYYTFNGKIVKLVLNCGALQEELYKSGVDVKVQYPIKEPAIVLKSIWNNLTQLHSRMWERKTPVPKKWQVKEALGKDRISSIYLTSEIPENICNYEALLDDLSIINLELFYIDHLCAWQKTEERGKVFQIIEAGPWFCARMEIPPGWDSSSAKYCKYFSEDWLISSAGEFFMAVRDLRLFIHGLRRDPFPKPVQYDDPHELICRIEEDLNQIEREFWDNIYKGGTAAAKSNNLTRYGEFWQRLYRMYDNCRIFLNLLRSKKIAYETFNPVPEALTIYNLGRTHDQELRRQMRDFFNRANPLEPKSEKNHVQFMYHFRACDADAMMLFPPPDLEELTKMRKEVIKKKERESLLPNRLRQMWGHYPGYCVIVPPNVYDEYWEPSPKIADQEISTSRPYRILPYIPSAELKLLNNPSHIEALCDSNIAKFQSQERDFKSLGKSAETYFTAVKKLRLSIWHWKEQFASAKPQDSGRDSADSPLSNSDSGMNSDLDSESAPVALSQSDMEELFQKAVDLLRQKEEQAAESSLMELAKRNYVPAWYLLSQIPRSRDSESFEEDVLAPETLLKKAAEAGYVPAVEKWLSTNALKSAKEQEDALRFAGRIQAVWRLAERMESMPKSSRNSWLNMIRIHAEKGDATCQLLLSYCYMRGNVINSSPAMAREWLQKAVVQNHPEALSLICGWHPQKQWNALDINWIDKAIRAGAIPVIAVSTLRRFNLPKTAIAHLERTGKQGNELAMLALICYYSKRNDVHSWQLEQWAGELARYRSLQELGYCSALPTDSSPFYQDLANTAQKALAEKK